MKIAAVFERPERGLLVLVLAQLICWTLAPAFSHSAPPLDVVEMYVWGREHVVATFKHPNLPGLVLEPTRWLFGAGWPAYLVSQAFIAITFWAVYQLGRDMMGAPRALVGTLLLTGVYFFSWTTPEFNHNVAQMPLWALVMLLLWRAVNNDTWWEWALLGLAAGFSLWAKYSSGVLLLFAAIWMVWDAQARSRILTRGPWITLGAFALAAAPQVLWLVAHDFQPFGYAARRASDGAWYAPLEFLGTLILDHVPMLILLACAGWFGKAAADAPPKPEQRALRYLLLMGLGPALLLAIGAAFTGSSLRSSWGAPMVVLSGLIAVALLRAKFSVPRLRRVGIGAMVLIVAVSSLYFAHMSFGVALRGKPLRGNWPQAEISAQLEGIWRSETNNAPLDIVAGDIWTSGLIGLNDRDPPSVLINGDFDTSPWVPMDELAQRGALVVWSGGQPAALRQFVNDYNLTPRELVVRPHNARPGDTRADIRIQYAILPPNSVVYFPARAP